MSALFEIHEYTEGERLPFAEWFDGLDAVTAARVSELRLDFGPGYRVYFGRDGKTLIILLGGGSNRRQDADIVAAIARWQRYQQAKKEK